MAIIERINVHRLEPRPYEILIEMEKYIATMEIPYLLRELIKIRVSQINKCAYCLDMHTQDARKAGETEQRIYAVSAWEESPLFTDKERAALAFAEEITKISEDGVTDATFKNMQVYFSDKQIAQMIIVVNQINFWNRIAVTTKQIYTGSKG